MTQSQVHLEYATDPTLRAGRVRTALLVAGLAHAAAALYLVGPYPFNALWRAGVAGTDPYGVPPVDRLISGVVFVGASVAFAVACAAAAVRPDGRAASAVWLAALIYLAVWLIDGARDTAFAVLAALNDHQGGPADAVAVIAGAAAREARQVSLLALVAYAFGRGSSDAASVIRAIAWAAAAACGHQFLERVAEFFQNMSGRGFDRAAAVDWLLWYVRVNRSNPEWGISITSAVAAVLVLRTYRRRPRVAGLLAVLPFVLNAAWIGHLWWAGVAAGRPMLEIDQIASRLNDLAIVVVGATSPLAALIVFTLFGQTAARAPTRG